MKLFIFLLLLLGVMNESWEMKFPQMEDEHPMNQDYHHYSNPDQNYNPNLSMGQNYYLNTNNNRPNPNSPPVYNINLSPPPPTPALNPNPISSYNLNQGPLYPQNVDPSSSMTNHNNYYGQDLNVHPNPDPLYTVNINMNQGNTEVPSDTSAFYNWLSQKKEKFMKKFKKEKPKVVIVEKEPPPSLYPLLQPIYLTLPFVPKPTCPPTYINLDYPAPPCSY